jgi:hypothetical protein
MPNTSPVIEHINDESSGICPMTPEQRERVRKIQERLDARGLQNIAFNISAGPTCTPSHVIADVCEALEAFLDGHVHKLPPSDDSQRKLRHERCPHGVAWNNHCERCD